jgi:hypothetical protein
LESFFYHFFYFYFCEGTGGTPEIKMDVSEPVECRTQDRSYVLQELNGNTLRHTVAAFRLIAYIKRTDLEELVQGTDREDNNQEEPEYPNEEIDKEISDPEAQMEPTHDSGNSDTNNSDD